jgi:hypothetical protein
MKREESPRTVRPLFEMGSEEPPLPEVEQEIDDRKAEAKRVIKRIYAIFEDHRDAAVSLKIKLGPQDLSFVNMPREGQGRPCPVPAVRFTVTASIASLRNLSKSPVTSFSPRRPVPIPCATML